MRVVDWSLAKQRSANVAANHQALQGEFSEGLAEYLAEVEAEAAVEMPGVFDELLMVDMLPGGDGRHGDALLDVEADPLPRKPDTRLGDLYVLGSHRLVCGDATDPRVVASVLRGAKPELMVTDPPYGVEYDPKWRNETGRQKTGRVGAVLNDDVADWREAWKLFPGKVAYVYHAGLFAATVQASLEAAGFEARAQIVWIKPRLVLSRGAYHWKHEPMLVVERETEILEELQSNSQPEAELAWYLVRRGATAQYVGGRKQTTVWEIGFAGEVKTVHSTQKPVECMGRPMRNHGARGHAVYEPFSGSGTTLIAAEQLERKCHALELSPAYCDVAVARWEKLTGRKAERIRPKASA